MSSVESWSTTAASNNAAPPDGFPEGQTPASLNNSAREVMAAVATHVRGLPWLKLSTGLTLVRNSATQFQLSGTDVTAIFTVGRRLREIGATTVYGAVATSTFTGGNTVVDVTNDAAAAIPTSLTAVDVAVNDTNASPAVVIAGLNTVAVNASMMVPATTSGCAPVAQTQLTAGQPELVSLDFDGTSDEFALFDFAFPKRWNLGTITARFYYTVNAAVSTTVKWDLQAVAVSDNDAIAVAFGTLQSVTDTFLGTANKLAVTATTPAITVGGTPALGDRIFFRVGRDPDNDTTSQDAKLLGLEIFYTTTTATDA
jgi:hypothetical protein